MPRSIHIGSGHFEPKRKLRVREYLAPEGIRLQGGRLFWQPVKSWRTVKPTGEVFDQFVQLNTAPDKAILQYAKRWGVLWLCKKHFAPASHDLNCIPLEREAVGTDEDLEIGPDFRVWASSEGEPLSEWRRWSRIGRTILEISQKLDDGIIGTDEHWQTLAESRWFDDPGWMEQRAEALRWRSQYTLAWERDAIAHFINRWLELGDVRPHLTASEKGMALDLTGGEPEVRSVRTNGALFGALAVSLLEVAGSYRIAACSGCRTFFNPEIRPRSGQDRFCEKCREMGVPVANAKHRKALGLSKPRKAKGKR